MIVAVLDTNVLASSVAGFTRPASIPAAVLRAWLSGRYRLVLSEHILIELQRALAKPYFVARLPAGQAETIIRLLRDLAQLVAPAAGVAGVASHPEDDIVLATALSGAAGYLVSGDAALLKLGRYQDVAILTPRAFLALLEEHQPHEVAEDNDER